MELDRSNYLTVTQVLGPFSGLSSIDPHILQRAADRGTAVHKMIAGDLMDIGAYPSEELQGYYESYCKIKDNIIDILCMEKRFYDDNLQLSGQIDLICNFQGAITLIDWKTPKKEGPTWGLQLSAYKHLIGDKYKVDQKMTVMLDRNGGEPQVIVYKNNYKKFLNLYEIYKEFCSKQRNAYDL